jgi:hypothetical protein
MNDYLSNFERVLGHKGTGSGEIIRFNCPFPGCAGYTKKAFCVNVRTGQWCCHHCQQQVDGKEYRESGAAGHGGGPKDFALMMNDNPSLWPVGDIDQVVRKVDPLSDGKKKQLWTMLIKEAELLEEHREMLRSRGIDGDAAGYVSSTPALFQKLRLHFGDEIMERGGLAYHPDNGDAGINPRQCVQPARILIPYWEKEQVIYFVGYARCPAQRPDQTEDQHKELKDRWAKAAGPAGYSPKVYGLAPPNAEYVIVTEGQIKTDAARQRGFPCIGISGIGMSHKLVAKHCTKQQVQRVIVLFDTQLEDQLLVDHEAMRLAKELLKVGIPTFRAELPQMDGEEKTDIDSFLRVSTASQFADILEEAGRHPYELETDAPAEENNDDEEAGPEVT